MRRKSTKKTTNIAIYLAFILIATAIPSFIRWAENQGIISRILNEETISVSNSEPLKVNISKLPDTNLYEVSKVVDGDTIKVIVNGEEAGIRLIGVDTPETVHPNKQVECFGKEASNFTRLSLENKKVYLLADDSQDNQDKYGRLLRYVVLEDGSLFNFDLVKLGFANEYTYQIPYEYQSQFKAAEKYASDNELGLWGEECK